MKIGRIPDDGGKMLLSEAFKFFTMNERCVLIILMREKKPFQMIGKDIDG